MNTIGKLKARKNKKIAPLGKFTLRWGLLAVIFVFALATAACPSFFGTYPFGLTVLAAVSGVFGAVAALAGGTVGTLIWHTANGGYLIVLSLLLIAARITVSWWLKRPDKPQLPRLTSASGPSRMQPEDPGQGPPNPLQTERHRMWSDRLRDADGTLLRENVTLRMAMGAVAVMFMGALSAAEGGFSYYSLFGAICSVLLSPILIYLMYSATEHYMRGSDAREAGIYTMAAIFTYALSAISPTPFNLGYCFAFVAAVATAISYGTVRGMVTGLLCGILLEPLYAPLFAIAAGVCGLLCRISPTFAVLSALISGIGWGIYVAGLDALARIVPPLALSAAVLLPLCHFQLLRLPGQLFGTTKALREAEYDTVTAAMHRQTAKHLTALSGSMKSISGVVYSLADRLCKPTKYELRALCEDSFERYCTQCSLYPTCYGPCGEKTAALIGKIADELYASGTASASAIPREFVKKCCNMGRILDEVNFQSRRRYAALALEDKLSVVAGDYEMMGELIGECLDYDQNEMKEDRELSDKLTRMLAYHDFRVGRVTAYGTRHKRIFVSDPDVRGFRSGAEDIRQLLEAICGFPMAPPEFSIDGSVLSMQIQSAFRYRAACGRASLGAGELRAAPPPRSDPSPAVTDAPMQVEEVIFGTRMDGQQKNAPAKEAWSNSDPKEVVVVAEEIQVEVSDAPPMEPSGDIISSFESDGRFYMLISDGMGSGREAAMTASVAAMFLERMLSAGASMETSLKMLNKLIRAGERECSATIDLAEIDLNTGEAKFIKSGAAPSFVIRNGSIYRLQSKTVPIGILRALDAEMIRFDVMEGDVIVMLSDGVAKSFEDCPWLIDLLTGDAEILTGEPARAAEKIVRVAAERGAADDITAGVIRISGRAA